MNDPTVIGIPIGSSVPERGEPRQEGERERPELGRERLGQVPVRSERERGRERSQQARSEHSQGSDRIARTTAAPPQPPLGMHETLAPNSNLPHASQCSPLEPPAACDIRLAATTSEQSASPTESRLEPPGAAAAEAAVPCDACLPPDNSPTRSAKFPSTADQPAAPAERQRTPPLAAHQTGDISPALGAELARPTDQSAASAERQRIPLVAERPIFHLIGKRVPGPPAGGPHLEVGVRGRLRCSQAPVPEPAGPEGRRAGRGLAFAAVAAVVVGSGFLVRAMTLADPVPPPLPPAWANRAVGAVGHRVAPLGYARPTQVTVGRVGIHAEVVGLGLGRDGEVGVPPAKEPFVAAWYDRGPAPGQAGPAVITGHVDSRFAPGHRAAFYELGAVRPGDDVDVARADRRVAVFRVDSVALVPKSEFPTREVYGTTHYAALRLITCGGHYDRRTGYADNVIVYAHLVGSH